MWLLEEHTARSSCAGRVTGIALNVKFKPSLLLFINQFELYEQKQKLNTLRNSNQLNVSWIPPNCYTAFCTTKISSRLAFLLDD